MKQFLISFGSPAIFPTSLKKTVKSACLLLFIVINASSCKKSSMDNGVGSGLHDCTANDNICLLTSHKWKMVSSTVNTDLGSYTYTPAQLATIDWATFFFKPDSTYIDYTGYTSTYVYTDSTKSLILIDNYLTLGFVVASLSSSSLTINGAKTQMNPQIDPSPEANFAIREVAGGLHNDFGVDTSTIHYVQPIWMFIYTQ